MKLNILQSQTLNGNTSRISEEHSGSTGRYQSSFSTVYRLVDLSLITVCFYIAAFYYNIVLNTTGLLLLFVSVVSYQVSAEALDLYRSWRSNHTSP